MFETIKASFTLSVKLKMLAIFRKSRGRSTDILIEKHAGKNINKIIIVDSRNEVLPL